MLAQRSMQRTLRKLAAQPNAARLMAPLTTVNGTAFQQKRLATTQTVSAEEGQSILAKQRLNRPVAPHLTIYRPQITWYPSMFNRITGVAASGVFYLYGLAYLAAPTFGWHLESAALAASFAAWPVLAQVATKFVLALPIAFHSINGVRHLVWDTASMITNKQVSQTGWAAVGLSGVAALALAFM